MRISTLENIITRAFKAFFEEESENIINGTSERNLVSRLAIILERLKPEYDLEGYYADAEYNRKQGGEIKTIIDNEAQVITIQCDLILHSRGLKAEDDNLIALEMKKSNRPDTEKRSDKNRLIALTKNTYDNIWSADGNTHPEHVCGYKLGFYMELNINEKKCSFEKYADGEIQDEWSIAF